MVFSLPEIDHYQLVFRGTDDTLIGWKEDFKLAYVREIPAHRAAVTYLEHYLASHPLPIMVSGHSKGGNLALYAVAHVKENGVRKSSKFICLMHQVCKKKNLSE